MNQICAVMDVQCFIKDGQYIPKELSIRANKLNISFIMDTGLDYKDMSLKDKFTNKHISKHILGMSLRSNSEYVWHKSNDGMNQIQLMYNMAKKPDKNYLGIKSNQLANLLNKLMIPYINLEDYGCPPIEKLKLIYISKQCGFHDNYITYKSTFRCANQKCFLLWEWVNNY